jgi:hypothetical protein
MLQPSQQGSILDDGTEYYPSLVERGIPARMNLKKAVHIYRFGKAGKHQTSDSSCLETIVGFALI